jgi:hypothetical protein
LNGFSFKTIEQPLLIVQFFEWFSILSFLPLFGVNGISIASDIYEKKEKKWFLQTKTLFAMKRFITL